MTLVGCAGCGCLNERAWQGSRPGQFGCPSCDAGLLLDLATWPWERFLDGSKTVEVRNWRAALARGAYPGRPIRLRFAYRGPPIVGTIGRVVDVPSWGAAPSWAVEGSLARADSPWFSAAGRLLLIEVLGLTREVRLAHPFSTK